VYILYLMKHRKYLERILSFYMDPDKTHLDMHVFGVDGCGLEATMTRSTSNVGVVIIPGISVPRESYFTLFASLSEYKVLVYDLRGQARSGGALEANKCVSDVNTIGEEFRRAHNLEYLIGIGHSYGGLALLEAGTKSEHPYDLRIALAPPLDLKESSAKMPKRFTKLAAYLYIIKRAYEKLALQDEIVLHYQQFSPLAFFRDPHIVALRLKHPDIYNATRMTTPLLADLVEKTPLPLALVFAGADNRISYANPSFEEVECYAEMRQFPLEILPHLSHRFNYRPEERFMLSYNNREVLEKVQGIIGDAVR
jgi:alpha-beta hydrolase superfamily lysophospholipase